MEETDIAPTKTKFGLKALSRVTIPHGYVAIVTSDEQGKIVNLNFPACELFGYTRAQLIGRKVNCLMPEPFSSQHDFYIARLLKTGESQVLAGYRVVYALHSSGKLFKAMLRISRYHVGDKQMFIATLEPLIKSKCVVLMNLNSTIVRVEGNSLGVFGFSASELEGKPVEVIVPSPHREKHQSYIERYEREGTGRVMNKIRNLHAQHRNGTTVPISLRVTEYNHLGQKLYMAKIHRVLEELETVLTLSTDGTIMDCSKAIFTMFGHKRKDTAGQHISKLLANADIDWKETFKAPSSEAKEYLEMLHRDGSVIQAVVRYTARFTDDGECVYHIFIRRISEDHNFLFSNRYSNRQSVKAQTKMMKWLGHFDSMTTIGQGYFGNVYRARHLLTGQHVAIKMLQRSELEAVGFAFPPREIDVLRRVNHPNIVYLLDTVTTPTCIYLIMELVEDAEDLFDFCLANAPLPEPRACMLFSQMVSALAYLHDHGIIHRDLKPENILTNRNGTYVTIIDLGFANFCGNNDVHKTMCGTNQYAAPELFVCDQYIGRPVDIWSLGIILFVMTTSLLPFRESLVALNERLKFPSHIELSPDLKDLIQRMLTISPAHRITCKDILRHPWLNKFRTTVNGNHHSSTGCSTSMFQQVKARLDAMGTDTSNLEYLLDTNVRNSITCTFQLILRHMTNRS
mmetsp:Transcript_13007/g.33191  ORF Transcript_13007/g.33191 Transcript_13007/m.33191 type:complete len:683 (-) Transcript_13007:130-2178(-)